jgi:hypothetical protein
MNVAYEELNAKFFMVLFVFENIKYVVADRLEIVLLVNFVRFLFFLVI